MGWRVIAESEADEIVEEKQCERCHGRSNDIQMFGLYVPDNCTYGTVPNTTRRMESTS